MLFFNGLDMFQNPTSSNDEKLELFTDRNAGNLRVIFHHLSLVKPSEADGYGIG